MSGPAGARADAGPFRLSAEPETLRADDRGMWSLRVRVENHTDMGLYPDSLFVDWVSDEAGGGRSGTLTLTSLASAMLPASGHEETGCYLNIPSEMRRGRLTVRLLCRDASKNRFAERYDVVVAGSDLEDAFPSLSLDVTGRPAELVVMRADSSAWPAPCILLLPRSGVAARSLLRQELALRERGYAVAILGAPGAGASQGPDDHAGPASIAAAQAAIARLRKDPGVDGKRIVLWGDELGGTTALLTAAREPVLSAVIAVDARFDPWADYRALDAGGREVFVKAAGRDSAGWRARAPLAMAERIGPPVLVVETEAAAGPGCAGCPDAAQAFASRRIERGLPMEARIHGREAKPVRRVDATRLATDFVARRTRSSGP